MTLLASLDEINAFEYENLGKTLAFEKFFKSFNIINYKLIPLRADCSKRRYYRVLVGKSTFILMDASEDRMSIKPFIEVDNFLIKKNFSAPQVYHQDIIEGLLLLEDFGKFTFTDYLKLHPHKELQLYNYATNILIHLHKSKLKVEVRLYDETLLNKELSKFVEWFLRLRLNESLIEKATSELFNIFNNLYLNLEKFKKVICLRDYMADNLMYLKDRKNYKKVGLLDFQDATLGNPAYDLVSILEDARRDVKPETVEACYNKYINTLDDGEEEAFKLCYTVLSLQRNLKIIGIFHSRNILDKNSSYLTYLPRVWKFIKNSLKHPEMSELKKWFERYEIELKH